MTPRARESSAFAVLVLCCWLGILPGPLPAQDTVATRRGAPRESTVSTLSGTWIARVPRSPRSPGTSILTLQLLEVGDAVSGNFSSVLNDVAHDAARPVSGTRRGDRFSLGDHEDTVFLEGRLHGDRLEATVTYGGGPGSGAPQASAHRGSGTVVTFKRKQ
jgi:hypothetical protein